MSFSKYRKEIRRLNSEMLFYKKLYPNTIQISGNAYNTAAIRCGLLDEFYKKRTRVEWREGRRSFLGKLLLS